MTDSFFEREGVNCLSLEDTEPYFSWSSCDVCRTTLGGMRYEATGYNPTTKEIYEYEICEDCAGEECG